MKTIIYLLLISTTLLSCKSYKLYNSQQIRVKTTGSESFEIEKGKMLIAAQLDGNPGRFVFDTGASGSLITDTLVLSDFYRKEKSSFGNIQDAQRNTINKVDFLVDFENGLMSASPKLISYFQISDQQVFECSEKSSLAKSQGIVGMDFFTWNKGRSSLLLDFTNRKLVNLERDKQQSLMDEGFKKIKSTFSILNQIYIHLNINNKEYKLTFDTGNNSTIFLPYSENENFTNLVPYEVIGNTYFSLSGMSADKRTQFYPDVDVRTDDGNYKTSVQVTENLNIYNVGLGFIQSFDWIIDFEDKEIYYRKNNTELSSHVPKINVGCLAMDGKLKIILLGGVYKDKYKLGDEITHVNQQKVTPENICEMQKLLNETKDWSTLHIEIE